MASGSITSWQIDGKTMKTVADFIFLGSKITVDGVHRKAMTNLDSILKSRAITLLCFSQSYGVSSSHVQM